MIETRRNHMEISPSVFKCFMTRFKQADGVIFMESKPSVESVAQAIKERIESDESFSYSLNGEWTPDQIRSFYGLFRVNEKSQVEALDSY